MIVKIQRKEINALKYACSLCYCHVDVFTDERNDKIVQCEILDEDGKDPCVNFVWDIARQMELKLACEAFARK